MGRAVTSTPRTTIARLSEEVQRFTELGFTHAKIKIGSVGLSQDQKRIETAAKQLRGGAAHLAVDAIYAYDAKTAPAAASMLAPFGLWWFERTPGAAKQGPKVAGCTRAQPMLAAESQL
jgi:L-alanine-DL-glutamate epimerase-like enolase superfamily enzyme